MNPEINGPETKGARLRILPRESKEDSKSEEVLGRIKEFYHSLKEEMNKVIVGQQDILEMIMIAILCRGHVLLEGVPGLGKTLMFKTLSRAMELQFQHIQFTPDLMPSDIIGTEIIQTDPETDRRILKFLQGPVFCNFLLADEINRTSPKTQSALLQAMQDREVSVGRITYKLEAPFFVLATQNPIDQEGVYPLPEAQLDRFMFNILIQYPTYEEEVQIAQRFTQNETAKVSKVIAVEELLGLQDMVRGMLISDALVRYAVDLVFATRPGKDNKYPFVSQWVEWGAGPRATLNLVLAAKARALLKGRFCVAAEDLKAVAVSVLRHRIKMNFSAEAEGMKSHDLVSKILAAVPEQSKHR